MKTIVINEEEPVVLERFEDGSRIEVSPITRLPVFVSPPGTPLLTSEIVRALMEDIP